MKLPTSLLFIFFSFVIVGFAVNASYLGAQDDEAHNFTGNVVESASDHLKVARVLQGKSEDRVFKVTAETKVEGGRLRARERVTVRYLSNDDGDIAILVIVRPTAKKQK